jgi:lipopolysaccharide/colanic/teichoic acid biosynthesis glycosyltransferase
MTLVGPRAEVPEMICHYHPEELAILDVRPGMTAPGQIYYTTDQAGKLDGVLDAEAYYVEHQLHPKLRMDLDYLGRRSAAYDLKVVVQTVMLLLGVRPKWDGEPT